MVLKELIFLYFWSCGDLERIDFGSFFFGSDVVVLKELIFHSFYF